MLSSWARRRYTAITIGLGASITALFVAGAVGLAATFDDADGTTVRSAAPAIAPPTPGRALPAVDLQAAIVPSPAGFVQIPDTSLKVAGKVDLPTVVKERDDPELARRMLENLGFTDAFVRSWQKPGSLERVTVRLYQFADEKGAVDYARSGVREWERKGGRSVSLPGATDAVAIDAGQTEGLQLVFAFGRRGRVVAAIAAVVAGQPVDAVAPVARAQLALLPA